MDLNNITHTEESKNSSVKNGFDNHIDFTIERSLLLKSLSILQSVAEKRNIIPILANIKISTLNNVLSLVATDMDITFTESLPANITKEGEVTVSAHKLYEIVRKLPEDSTIKMFSDSENLGSINIKSSSCSFKLSCLPIDDFPVMENSNMPCSFEIEPKNLLKLIEKTIFAVSTEETRYYLNGIFFHSVNKNGKSFLVSVATDGHRLAKSEVELSETIESIPEIIVPRKTINEIKKIINNAENNIKISISETKICFTHNETILLSKLIDGNFPDYEKVIPKENDIDMKIDYKYLLQAVDRVSTLSSEKTRAIKFNISKDKLTLSATNEDNSQAEELLQIDCNKDIDNPIDIGFNSRYILEMLSVFEGSDALFKFSSINNTSPVIVFDNNNQNYFFVIMPMRI